MNEPRASGIPVPLWHRRPWLLALGFVPLYAVIHFAAFWLRYEGNFDGRGWQALQVGLLLACFTKLVVFSWMGVFHGWTRFVTFHDVVILSQAATASSLLLAVIDYLFFPALSIPRSVFLMDWGGTIVGMGGLRAIIRWLRETDAVPFTRLAKIPVLIVGANESGEALLREIRRNGNLPYRVLGFVAEQPQAVGLRLGGVPVVGTLNETNQLAKKLGVREVLIVSGELAGSQVRRLIEDGQQHGVTVKVLPSYEQLLRGAVDMRPRTVSIEDLLRREPVQLDSRELRGWLVGKTILVTGSAGSIGSEICRQLLQYEPARLVLVDRSETGQFFLERELQERSGSCELVACLADAADAMRMNGLFVEYAPDIVFHAAAYKHVPLMESNPGEALRNIVSATRVVADLARHHDVEAFVMISTDKAVNPTSVMGACKRVAEMYVQALSRASSTRFVTVRFGNVLDSAGSVIPIFRQQIAKGGPVTVTHPDMTRYFMTIPEASQLVLQAGVMGKGGEICVLDMGDPVRIVDLASDMIRLSGLRVGDDIAISFVGLRPGEKLYEELYSDRETQQPTSHSKIRIAASEIQDLRHISRRVDELLKLTHAPHAMIREALGRLVPGYQGCDRQREAA